MPRNQNLVEYKPLDLHWQDHQIVCKLAPIQKVDIHKGHKAEKKEKYLEFENYIVEPDMYHNETNFSVVF